MAEKNPFRCHSFERADMIRKYALRISNYVTSKKISPQQATAIRGLMALALQSLKDSEFEMRLDALEKMLSKKQRKKLNLMRDAGYSDE